MNIKERTKKGMISEKNKVNIYKITYISSANCQQLGAK